MLVLIGIIGALVIVMFVYRFTPVIIQVHPSSKKPVDAGEMNGSKMEAIQMEKMPPNAKY